MGSDAYCVEHFAMSLVPRNYSRVQYVQNVIGEPDDNPYRSSVKRGRNGLDFDNGTYYNFRLPGTFSTTTLIFAILMPGLLAGTFSGWWRGRKIIASQHKGLLK